VCAAVVALAPPALRGPQQLASPSKKSYPLRIDPALWAEIERLAAQELRSANAQVEYLLREALAKRGRLPQAEPSPETDESA
jgi:hypothetical protein